MHDLVSKAVRTRSITQVFETHSMLTETQLHKTTTAVETGTYDVDQER